MWQKLQNRPGRICKNVQNHPARLGQYNTRMVPVPGALDRLRTIPSVDLLSGPSPIHELPRLREALGGGPCLLIKRDDVIPFAFGGNKVRKLAVVAAEALSEGADTLLTIGGIQSNHARVTAATAAKLGLHCALILNGIPPATLAANILLDALLGAELHFVATREERMPAMARLAETLRRTGRHPYEIPLGASTPLGALGMARAVGELVEQGVAPDVIVHSTSSGGTQAGLVAGCTLFGLPTRVLGISADDPAKTIQDTVRDLIADMGELVGTDGRALAAARPIEVDDTFVGDGYGIPTEASREAVSLLARTEAVFVDHTYTAKALAGLIAHWRRGTFAETKTVLFWHTGGQMGLLG
jgi:1-aminocyclopropane-1-carboxylate deaminase/D-cysteine desulfhydrase-like pyridoxal-dependent ACC family enzyme